MLSVIWESFYSAELYKRIREWRGKALVYLLLLLSICWIPGAVKFQQMVSRAVNKIETEVSPKIPNIRFDGGKVTTPENKPYVYHYKDEQNDISIIVDTSGKYSTLDGQPGRLLLTSNKLFIRKKNGELSTYDLSQSKAGPFVIDAAFKQKVFTFVRRWTTVLVFPFIFVMSFLKRLIQAFLIALLGLAIVSILEAKLDLGELLSVAIVAMTPAMIVQTIWIMTPLPVTYSWLVSAGLILAYFIYGINSASIEKQETN